MDRHINRFYKNNHTPLRNIVRIGAKRRGLRKDAILKAAELIYYERDKWPTPALVPQIFCKARNLNVRYIAWSKRPWWKRFIQAIFFPRTLIWEYSKWDM